MSDREKVEQLIRQAEALRARMIAAGYTSPGDPEPEPEPANPELDLEAEIEKTKAEIRQFSKRIK